MICTQKNRVHSIIQSFRGQRKNDFNQSNFIQCCLFNSWQNTTRSVVQRDNRSTNVENFKSDLKTIRFHSIHFDFIQFYSIHSNFNPFSNKFDWFRVLCSGNSFTGDEFGLDKNQEFISWDLRIRMERRMKMKMKMKMIDYEMHRNNTSIHQSITLVWILSIEPSITQTINQSNYQSVS
jgi:hypothetical protein